ncbi:MAG: hypothetical protein DCC88_00865 [Spirobacillus cienkowskii]|uniref:AB hydrolase-1 domain-containing protein n=1 Tax=Spirobacillus cienkowskii TaxID=495820 RepID=A0A369KWX6_9BACT|nr:MAG: hypothetical protein DCC88_00865 [Spirobacillus cienkowskii]
MTNLHFLHGFLGLASDWHCFAKDFKEHDCKFHNIYDYLGKHENNQKKRCFYSWANNFNATVLHKNDTNQKNILIGYSLGGRLALHALIESKKWDAAIIISANPGLLNNSDKQARILNDKLWSHRFLTEKWEFVLHLWNSQDIFLNSKINFNRAENNFNKIEIANILNKFSLGKQENLREKIKNLDIPILWLAGENDIKFIKILYEMKDINKKIEAKTILDSGHRSPWENQAEFVKISLNFINKI